MVYASKVIQTQNASSLVTKGKRKYGRQIVGEIAH